MKILLLMRHGKAVPAGDLGDHERPLAPRGLRAGQLVGRELSRRGWLPERVTASTAVRARDTAASVVAALGRPSEIRTTRALYLAPPSAYLSVAREAPVDAACQLLVGHNPGLEDLASALAGEAVSMPTAAVAAFELAVASWLELDGASPARWLGLLLPRELDG